MRNYCGQWSARERTAANGGIDAWLSHALPRWVRTIVGFENSVINDLWYKNAIVYCLSVATYMDSDGDGVGDFKGSDEAA